MIKALVLPFPKHLITDNNLVRFVFTFNSSWRRRKLLSRSWPAVHLSTVNLWLSLFLTEICSTKILRNGKSPNTGYPTSRSMCTSLELVIHTACMIDCLWRMERHSFGPSATPHRLNISVSDLRPTCFSSLRCTWTSPFKPLSRIYYESVWLKIWISRQFFLVVSPFLVSAALSEICLLNVIDFVWVQCEFQLCPQTWSVLHLRNNLNWLQMLLVLLL
jgi:hypothetical protein